MKVKDMIEQLSKLDGELEVMTEGCDCYGESKSICVESGCYWTSADDNLNGKSVSTTRSGLFVLIERNS